MVHRLGLHALSDHTFRGRCAECFTICSVDTPPGRTACWNCSYERGKRGTSGRFHHPPQLADPGLRRRGPGSGAPLRHPGGCPDCGAPPRIRDSFDFGWKFFKGDAPARSSPASRTQAGAVSTCRTTGASKARSRKASRAAAQGGYAPTGIGWYRKRFRVPAAYRDRKVTIEFDGVYQNSEVWINGHYLGKRPFGYISFAYDLTPHLNAGGDNVVAVKVDNSVQPGSRWYSGSGIYRHTWLVAVNPVHVAHWGTFVTTPRVPRSGHGRSRPRCAMSGVGRGIALWPRPWSTAMVRRSRRRRQRRQSAPTRDTSSRSSDRGQA